MDPETEFMKGMMALQYGEDVIDELRELSNKVGWAAGWPSNNVAFWNAEAFMWGYKVDKKIRKVIEEELSSLKGVNLDVGCGAYSYIKSVGVDISPKMLQLNDNLSEKVVGTVFDVDREFDSVTAVFVLNYVKELGEMLNAIKERLVKEGEFVVVLSGIGVNKWQRQKEVNKFSFSEWEEILGGVFYVSAYEKQGLWFFKCRNI